MISGQCNDCQRYLTGWRCDAYKDKAIPQPIRDGEHDHTKPYEGDNGIRFTPLPKE